MKTIILTLATTIVLTTCSLVTERDDGCSKFHSCSSCLSKSYCVWCVNQSKCTKQSCSNGNIIYHKRIRALMSGIEFCPRIVRPEIDTTFENGKKQTLVVKLTQIHLYMAFTVWKCKITLNGEETVVNALLKADEVHCDPVELSNKTGKPIAEGTVTVLWDNNKSFDGSFLFKVSL